MVVVLCERAVVVVFCEPVVVVVFCKPAVADGAWLPVPVAGVVVEVVEAVVSDPVAAVVVAVVLDAADSVVVDVGEFGLAAARLRKSVWLLSYLPSSSPLKLTQVSPCDPSFSDMC